MSKEKNLIPELRFPEFVNEGEWIEITIESVGDVVTGGTPSKEEDEYWGGDFVWVTAQDFKEKYIYNSTLKLTKKGKDKSRVIPKNSVLVTCIASIGLNGINKVECATNQQINSIVCNSSNHYEFIYYAISKNITRLKNLAGQTAVPIISKSIFEKFTIQKPQKPEEQQKIASCLSSLDEVIAAHSQKLDLLKEHKKGLLQNLFPQKGEKVPKLRFKEFVNDGEWVEKSLDKVVNNFIVPMRDKPKKLDGEIPWCRIEDFNGIYLSESKSNQGVSLETVTEMNLKIYPTNTLLVSCSADLGRCAITQKPLITNQTFIGLVIDEKKMNSLFLYYIMTNSRKELNARSSGTTISYLSRQQFEQFAILLPPQKDKKEQQKIASCLASLDTLITAQTEKIEQLRLHKKGLMQCLFPKINE